jgi:tRNA G10  N-methylase Trm11
MYRRFQLRFQSEHRKALKRHREVVGIDLDVVPLLIEGSRVELVARMVRNSSREGELVYDPFYGSGSTLLAAHQ